MLYRIERITDRTGRDREDGRNPQRIGREGHLMPLAYHKPMALIYVGPDDGTLTTSPVRRVGTTKTSICVETEHSVYYLRRVEAQDPAWPEPIDLEEPTMENPPAEADG